MTVLHSGTTKAYSGNFDKAFGKPQTKASASKKKAAPKKSAPKKAPAKKSAAKKK